MKLVITELVRLEATPHLIIRLGRPQATVHQTTKLVRLEELAHQIIKLEKPEATAHQTMRSIAAVITQTTTQLLVTLPLTSTTPQKNIANTTTMK